MGCRRSESARCVGVTTLLMLGRALSPGDFDLETYDPSGDPGSDGYERPIEVAAKALGLTLHSTHAPRDVLVIVSAAPPS